MVKFRNLVNKNIPACINRSKQLIKINLYPNNPHQSTNHILILTQVLLPEDFDRSEQVDDVQREVSSKFDESPLNFFSSLLTRTESSLHGTEAN